MDIIQAYTYELQQGFMTTDDIKALAPFIISQDQVNQILASKTPQ
jgi:hypothetical protein